MSSALKDLTLSESFAFSDSIQAVSSRMGKNVIMILEVLRCNFCFDQFDNQLERLWWPYDVVISEQNRGPWRNPARYCHYRHLNHPKSFKLRYPWLRNLWHSTYTTSFLFCMPRKSLQLCKWENNLLSSTFTRILSPSRSRNTCWQTLWPQPALIRGDSLRKKTLMKKVLVQLPSRHRRLRWCPWTATSLSETPSAACHGELRSCKVLNQILNQPFWSQQGAQQSFQATWYFSITSPSRWIIYSSTPNAIKVETWGSKSLCLSFFSKWYLWARGKNRYLKLQLVSLREG